MIATANVSAGFQVFLKKIQNAPRPPVFCCSGFGVVQITITNSISGTSAGRPGSSEVPRNPLTRRYT